MKMLINDLINKKGLKKSYIAQELNVNRTTLMNWMKGKTYPPLDKAVQLAKLLDVKLEDLFEDEE